MKFSIRFADQIVGTLVILALAILVFVIFMLGKNQRWFVNDYLYKTYLTSAAGVSRNMPIQYKGFTIGHVKDLSLAEDDRVEISFSIFNEYNHRVTEGSLIEVQVSPIGLGNSFIFYPGRGIEALPAGSVIPEISSSEAKIYISNGLADVPYASDSIGNIVNHINTILEGINLSLSGEKGAEELPLGQILLNVEGITSHINYVLGGVANPSGPVMTAIGEDGTLYTNLEASLESLSGIINSLDETAEYLPAQLPQVVIFINELNTAIRTLQDVLTAIGNNPLLKGGMPERLEAGPGGASPRNMEF